MATAPTLYVPTQASFMDGMREQQTQNNSRRVANRDALLKMSEEASAQGQSLTIEDLMRQSQATMGFGDFLRSTSPSVDMMNGIVRNQNAKAEQVAEERRRSQFTADTNESKVISEDAKSLFLAGKPEVDVYAELVSRHGEERISKLRPQLGAIAGRANHEALRSGMEMGQARFGNEYEAKEYVSGNPWLPKQEAEGILIGSRKAWSATENSIMKKAAELGSGGGWTGTAEDALLANNAIDTLAPTLPSEQKAALAKRFIEVAGSSAKTMEKATDYKNTQEAVALDAKNAPAVLLQTIKLEAEADESRRKAAEAQRQVYTSNLQAQHALAKALEDPKNKQSKLGASTMLRSHFFPDPEAYLAALEKGDKREIDAIKARAIPNAEYLGRADSLSSIVSGAHNSDLPGLYARMGEFGADDRLLTSVGKEIKAVKDLRAADAPSQARAAGAAAVDSDPYGQGAYSFFNFGDKTKPTTGQSDSNAAQNSALAAAETRLKTDFVADSAEYLKQVRQAITSNGRVAATPEQILAEEQKVAIKRATVLVRGMGLVGPVAEATVKDFANQILQAAGSAGAISARPSIAEQYKQGINALSDRRGLPSSTGRTPPGGLRPNASAYPPANF